MLCWTDLRITNHRWHKFPLSLMLLLFKTWIEWPLVLTAATSFQSLFFQFLQYSRQYSSFLAHKAALMTKTALTFPAFLQFSSAFAVSFHFTRSYLIQVWQWCDVLDQSQFFALHSNQRDCFILYRHLAMIIIVPCVPLFCSYRIVTSSVIFYWPDTQQHGIYYLLNKCTALLLNLIATLSMLYYRNEKLHWLGHIKRQDMKYIC